MVRDRTVTVMSLSNDNGRRMSTPLTPSFSKSLSKFSYVPENPHLTSSGRGTQRHLSFEGKVKGLTLS